MVSKPVTSRSISRSALLISAAVAAGCGAPRAPKAESVVTLALYNGDVRTMDPERPRATALAIAGERIVAVGSDAEIRKLAGSARAVDLGGKTVTPGLIDAHCHLYGLGADLEAVSVRQTETEVAAVELVVSAARTRPAGEWLLGRGWDQNRWPGQAFPTRASLDAAIADRPVALRRVDGHAIWVNTRALEAARITKATPDPAGGRIVRDAAGEPTGVLIDNAVDLIDRVIPAPTEDIIERRILAAARLAIAAGITGVHEMGIDDATAAVYERLARADRLPLRVYAYLAGDPGNLERVRVAPAPPVGRFALRGVKYFADGALGSRGARLYRDYDDDPTNRGLWVTAPDQLALAIDAAVSGGWQTAIHAIGDAAIGSVLDAYLVAQKKHEGDRRLRIEHVQVIEMEDVPRLVESRAIASMQPTHATSDMTWAGQRVGDNRLRLAYAWRTMLDKGVPLAFGSDFPVEDVRPILGIYAAVTRQDAEGKPADGWQPRQRISLDEAIAAFTRGAAYAEHAEHVRGMIAVGRDADVTVFDRALSADRSLLDTGVALTIVGGVIASPTEVGRAAAPQAVRRSTIAYASEPAPAGAGSKD
jgi:predicted amidohydrolase YtcJ